VEATPWRWYPTPPCRCRFCSCRLETAYLTRFLPRKRVITRLGEIPWQRNILMLRTERAVNVLFKRIFLVLLVLLSLPIVLLVYNPSLLLGGLGLVLGGIAMTISPLVLFGSLLYLVTRLW
jgi:hypothetical protein